jgi:hypothetical protein
MGVLVILIDIVVVDVICLCGLHKGGDCVEGGLVCMLACFGCEEENPSGRYLEALQIL